MGRVVCVIRIGRLVSAVDLVNRARAKMSQTRRWGDETEKETFNAHPLDKVDSTRASSRVVGTHLACHIARSRHTLTSGDHEPRTPDLNRGNKWYSRRAEPTHKIS